MNHSLSVSACRTILPLVLAPCILTGVLAAGADEFKVKREEIFTFSRKPLVTRSGDMVTIDFESKGWCDVTVAIETAGPAGAPGRIVRHLASGVLGPKAPPPLVRDSRRQTLQWDGKNDRGEYVENKEALAVRVSLGLRPRFERTLFWSPKRRSGAGPEKGVAIRAAPEGVYVYDGGQAVDHIRLFSHEGDYVRTVYPFPAGKLKDVRGLITHAFPQDGKVLPVKPSYQMCTLLTSGENAMNIIFKEGRYVVGPMDPCHKGEYGRAATDLAVSGERIAVGANRLNRLATDGGSPRRNGGPADRLNVYGPNIDLRNARGFYKATDSAMSLNLYGGYELLTNLKPHRLAFSPDGRTLYLTRFIENFALDTYMHNYWQHGVYRMAYEEDREPTLFLGAVECGSDAGHFNMPADVTCDGQGRIYVADMGNHRVQIFTPDGKLVKSLPVEAPAQVAVSPAGEVYVFTWELLPDRRSPRVRVTRPYTLRKFKSADDPRLLATYDIPMAATRGSYGQWAEVDFWAQPRTIWISPGAYSSRSRSGEVRTQETGILMLAEKNNTLEVIRDFQREARREVLRTSAPGSNRQRLYCDPVRGVLYVGEGGFHFQEALQVDPATGRIRLVQLPFDAEDMCFDADGLAYLRTPGLVARYDPAGGWREVPWDYGEERRKVTYNSHSGRREATVASGLPMPVNSGWHHGGMHVSPRGHLAVGCLYRFTLDDARPRGQEPINDGKPYATRIYPGRIVMAAYGCEYVHVWDRRGKSIREDAIPGLGTLNGVAIDNDDGLYVLSAAPRVLEGKPHFNFLAGTLMKFGPGPVRILSDEPKAPVPLPATERPSRPPDLCNLPGNAWVEGAEWFLGGIGWHGKNHGLGCGCRNTRFALDYFGRSYAPETDRYSVAVLDSAGNVILRIGQYGNVDDGMPLAAATAHASGSPQADTAAPAVPPNPRSIGGDEVSFMHPAYAAVHTDRRLFVADIGNYRIASIALSYHAEERVALKDVADTKPGDL